MTRPIDLTPLANTLEIAARRHAEARRREAENDLSRLELMMLLFRFGLEPAASSEAVAKDDARFLSAAASTALRLKVRGELALLARLARRRDPRYDLNRHVAVARLVRWLDRRRTWCPPRAAPGSGLSRNQRFRRNGAR